MMWNSFAKLGRLEKALSMRGFDPRSLDIARLLRVLRSRGIADAELNPLVWRLIDALEPPPCLMSHCKHYGGQKASMACGIGRIPGRCKIYRDYLARKKERTKSK